jgi:hypothetical protein
MHFNTHSIEILSSDLVRLANFSETYNSSFNGMYNTFDFYGFDGGLTGLGEIVYIPTGSLSFANHACGHKSNFLGRSDAMLPYAKEIWDMWNPVGVRIRTELNHVFIATRDIQRGEMITDDYTTYDNFVPDAMNEAGQSGQSEIKEWCGETA